MITIKKLMTVAVAVAALTTASIAATGDAFARGGGHGGGHVGGGFRGGFSGSAKLIGGGRHFGGQRFSHHRHGYRYVRFGGYGYNDCLQYTPYGLVNICE